MGNNIKRILSYPGYDILFFNPSIHSNIGVFRSNFNVFTNGIFHFINKKLWEMGLIIIFGIADKIIIIPDSRSKIN